MIQAGIAERQRSSGTEYLRAVVLGYELYWRLREHLYRAARGYAWDHVDPALPKFDKLPPR